MLYLKKNEIFDHIRSLGNKMIWEVRKWYNPKYRVYYEEVVSFELIFQTYRTL